MAEKVLEKPICEACGVDVRSGSMFCYNCGGAVSDAVVAESAEQNTNGTTKLSDAWLREDLAEEQKTEAVAETNDDKSSDQRAFAEADSSASADSTVETVTENRDDKTSIQENAKLKSAAAMRRKAKSFQAKPVEVVWEEPENSSTGKLILVALILTLFAVGIVILALYLK